MSDDASTPTPEQIEDRLRKLRAAESGSQGGTSDTGLPASSSATAGLGFAMRLGVELVSALAVGAGIGYGLDRLLGTGPWLLVLFFFIGSAAGMLNVWRIVNGQGYGLMPKPKSRAESDDEDDEDEDEER